jgi:hypothetical protein
MTSAPIRSTASSNQIALPADLCISWPCSSRTRAWPSSVLKGGMPSIIVLIASSA